MEPTNDIFMAPSNGPRETTDYAVGIGWVLPAGVDCAVCPWTWAEGADPHPFHCDGLR